MKSLVEYSKYNTILDVNIYDCTNALFYLYETNTTSQFYGSLTNNEETIDYIGDNIEEYYNAIKEVDLIEYKYDLFQSMENFVNLNCSVSIIKDDNLQEVFNDIKIDYDNYFSGLCEEFPILKEPAETNLYYEIIYMIDILSSGYEQNEDFETTFKDNISDKRFYDSLTLILIFNRMRRAYFNEKIMTSEIEVIKNEFFIMIITYLVGCVVLELILFLVLYFVIILNLKQINKLILDFLASIKFN